MKIWTTEHVFGHSWETVIKSQFQKYPNPEQPAVLGTDVLDRSVDGRGVLHSHRLIQSDWGLAPWVQSLIGANRVCFAHEYSTVDPAARVMEMRSVNMTFCNYVSMNEYMTYRPHPQDPSKTMLKQETVVTVQGVPLTSYMESIILNTVSANSGKGRKAMEWVIQKVGDETKLLGSRVDQIKAEIADLTHKVEDKVIHTARKSLEELQRDLKRIHTPALRAQEQKAATGGAAAAR